MPIEKPAPRRRLGRILAGVAATLLALLVIAYFVATSSAFLKSVILPRAGRAFNAQITVEDASISPFSEIELRGLKVIPNGREQLLSAGVVRARYNLRQILRGNMVVDEITAESPVITLVEQPDGSSNLDPLTKKNPPATAAQPSSKSPSSAPHDTQLALRNIHLKNARLVRTVHGPAGAQEVTTLSALNLSLDTLQNGLPGKMDFASDIAIDHAPAPGGLQSHVSGQLDYKLSEKILPESLRGTIRLDVSKADGQFADLSGLATVLEADVSPTELKNINLRFEQAGQSLGEVRVSGPFSAQKLEGNLKVETRSLDRRVLNLAGASRGLAFNDTKITFTSDLTLAQAGQSIAAKGQFTAANLSVTQNKKLTTPPLDLQLAYNVALDRAKNIAVIQSLNLTAQQNGKTLLESTLSKPMTLSLGGSNSAPEEAALTLSLTDLNLADWTKLLGDTSTGLLNAKATLLSQKGGNTIAADLSASLQNASATFGSNRISNAGMNFTAKATISEMQKIDLSQMHLELTQANKPALTLDGSGAVNAEKKDLQLKVTLDASVPALTTLAGMEKSFTSGSVKFQGLVSQAGTNQTVQGKLLVADLTGLMGKTKLDRFGVTVETDLALAGDRLQIKKAAGLLEQSGRPGGAFDLTGDYNLKRQIGQLAARLSGLNQDGLGPFLQSALGEQKLISVAVNGTASAQLGENSNAVFKANCSVTNLVVRDPRMPSTNGPLAADFVIDGSMRQNVATLNQFQIGLSPTARARNILTASGSLDLRDTNAFSGKMTVQSDSLDLTSFYDLYAGASPTAKPALAARPGPSTPTGTPSPSGPAEEPAAIKLPIGHLVADINVARVYLREIDVKDFRATATVDGSHAVLKPMSLTLNGAPVTASFDLGLGQKGYSYVVSFSADKVPIEPIANTFTPEKRGAYQGQILASAQVKGAGVTGASLKTNLTAQINFRLTNANLQIVGPRLRPFLSTIALALQTPELTTSPLKWVSSDISIGGGVIELKRVQMLSDAFTADTSGKIPISDILTNSPLNNLPFNIALSKNLAQRTRYISSGTAATNGDYVALPSIIQVTGTLGEPKPKIDKVALLGTVAEKLGGKIPGVSDKTGSLIQGLGGILTGKAPAPAVQTNSPSAPQPPPSTNQVSPADLLRGLFKK